MDRFSKIYIAGHTGMVGSAIHRNLISKGYTNFVFTPFPQYDLTEQKAVSSFFEKEKPEYVILAAAKVGGIMANNTFRAQFIYENTMIQSNIIHQSYIHKVKKLLFLGSSCIYPKNCPQPIMEEYLLTGDLEYTNEPYAISKISGIKMCEAYNIQYGTNFLSVMPTNLYGPNDNYNLANSHVLPAMIRKMHLGKCLENNDWEALRKDLKKRPIDGVNEHSDNQLLVEKLESFGIKYTTHNPQHGTRNMEPAPRIPHPVAISLWGTGTPYREFLYVEDLADACVFLMQNINISDLLNLAFPSSKASAIADCALSSLPHAEIKNTHINIGSGRDQTILELAKLVKRIIGFNGELLWDSSKPDGTPRKLLDVSKINKLGWKEKISLEEGIRKVYDNYIIV